MHSEVEQHAVYNLIGRRPQKSPSGKELVQFTPSQSKMFMTKFHVTYYQIGLHAIQGMIHQYNPILHIVMNLFHTNPKTMGALVIGK